MTKSDEAISLCMIVRNEERLIGQCLASVRDFVDEMIVVDTGSEDATREIARQCGARIFQHPWSGDFGEARNHSISQALGKWILVLDADETMAARDAQQLRSLVRNTHAWGFKLIQRTYLWNANFVCAVANPRDYAEGREYSNCVEVGVIRFFRNVDQIRYRGRVHELVEPVFAEKRLAFETTNLVLHHFGKVGDPAHLETKKRLYLDLGVRKAREHSKDPMAQFELGVQLYELDRYSECIPCFKIALRLNPGFDLALLYVAKAYHMSGKMDQAGPYYQKCMRRSPGNDKVLFDYANFVRDQGDFKSALDFYRQTLAANPAHSLALFNSGMIHVRQGDIGTGLEWIARAIQSNPDNITFYANLGRLPFTAPQLELSAGWVENYLERFPRASRCHASLAEIYFKMKRFDAALASSQRAVDIEPNQLSSVLTKANCQFALGRLIDAGETYHSALLLAEDNLDAMMNLATIAERGGDYVSAKSWYRRILKTYPDQPQALKRYVRSQVKSGLDPDAGTIIQKAYSANSGDLECLLLVGALLERSGSLESAKALYRDAAQQHPDWAGIAEQKRQRLESVHASPVQAISDKDRESTL